MNQSSEKTRRMSDAAVQARTGKTWHEWFSIMDAAGADKMSHQEIVAYLTEKHDLPPWWRQMVTVTYEQERGLRAVHETPEGYQVSVSLTVPVPVATLYQSWESEEMRRHWLKESAIKIRKATPPKSMRITWSDKTNVEVNFYRKGESKSQVVVQHTKLTSPSEVAKMKSYWKESMVRLRRIL